jgi:hypothetical protein
MFMFNKTNAKIIPQKTTPLSKSPLKNCDHNIIKDWIDLTPDSGKTIYYCEKCLSTFMRDGDKFNVEYYNGGAGTAPALCTDLRVSSFGISAASGK